MEKNFNLSVIAKAIVNNVEKNACMYENENFFSYEVEEELDDFVIVADVNVECNIYEDKNVNYSDADYRIMGIDNMYLQFDDTEYYFTKEEVKNIIRMCA